MDGERPATEPKVLVRPLGKTDFAPRSSTPANRHDVSAPGVWGTLRSPTFS